MIIGAFNLVDGAYVGTLPAILGGNFARIAPTDRKGVDYVVTMSGTPIELGLGWKRTSEKGNGYVSVKLDSPMLPAPANCALVKQADGFALVWNRARPKAAKAGQPPETEEAAAAEPSA